MNKTQIYNSNLCKEILLTAQKIQCQLGTGEFYVPYTPEYIIPKYQFSRAKWYEGNFDWRKYDEVHDWCIENFGKHDISPDAWSRWWHKYENIILLRDEKDYVMFMLRWS